jgi:hypothetical protein
MKSSGKGKAGAKKKAVKKAPSKKAKVKKAVERAVKKKVMKKSPARKKTGSKKVPVKKALAMKVPAMKAAKKGAMDALHESFRSEILEQLKSLRSMNAVHDDFKIEILGELRELRAMVERTVRPPATADSTLEAGVDSLRRLLSEVMEQRLENHMAGLIDLRIAAVSSDCDDATTLTAHIDRLLYEMGAIRFEADRMDYVDPLIHEIVAEHHEAGMPDGVVVETLLPGFRTARGAIVAKAHVAVNRRI